MALPEKEGFARPSRGFDCFLQFSHGFTVGYYRTLLRS